MYLLFSIPVILLVLFLVVQAFTHPVRATIFLARLVLAIVGLIGALFSAMSINSAFAAPSAAPIILVVISLAVTIGCFALRNRLGRI